MQTFTKYYLRSLFVVAVAQLFIALGVLIGSVGYEFNPPPMLDAIWQATFFLSEQLYRAFDGTPDHPVIFIVLFLVNAAIYALVPATIITLVKRHQQR